MAAGTCAGATPAAIKQITLLDSPYPPVSSIRRRYLASSTDKLADFYTSALLGGWIDYGNQTHHLFVTLFSHSGVHEWYTDKTIYNEDSSALLQDGFWYSPWFPSHTFPMHIGLSETEQKGIGQFITAKEITGYDTFGYVSFDNGIYTITEDAGNAGIYKTVLIPANVQEIAFQYRFSSAGDGDYLSVHMGTNEAVYIGADLPISREDFTDGTAYITSLSGQTVQLVFKLVSRGQPNAQVQIRAIEFLTETDYVLAPENVTASDGTFTDKVLVSWDTSSGATSYEVWRNTSDSSASASKISSPDPTGTSYDDTSAAADITYYYWVKAVNVASASLFSASDSGFIGVVGPLITANGLVGDVYLNSGDAVTIAVQMMNIEPYVGVAVDWWVVACAGSSWYYLNSSVQWTPEGNLLNWRPVYQGGLFNLPATEVLNIKLGVGSYTFYFAVDYPMDGILNLDGPILVDSVNVVVQ